MTMMVATRERGIAREIAGTAVFMDHAEIVETALPEHASVGGEIYRLAPRAADG